MNHNPATQATPATVSEPIHLSNVAAELQNSRDYLYTYVRNDDLRAVLEDARDYHRLREELAHPDLREDLAALEHEQWISWTAYMLDALEPVLMRVEPPYRAERPVGLAMLRLEGWRRQIATEYRHLTEAEKDSDREWADRILALFPAPPSQHPACDPTDAGSGDVAAEAQNA